MTDNRLTPEEEAVLKKAKQFFLHGSPKNGKHLKLATKRYIRSEHKAADEAQAGARMQ